MSPAAVVDPQLISLAKLELAHPFFLSSYLLINSLIYSFPLQTAFVSQMLLCSPLLSVVCHHLKYQPTKIDNKSEILIRIKTSDIDFF